MYAFARNGLARCFLAVIIEPDLIAARNYPTRNGLECSDPVVLLRDIDDAIAYPGGADLILNTIIIVLVKKYSHR